MSPILGIFASQGRVAANSYESIQTVTVGAGGTSTITFSSIPSTYKHLQLRFIAKTSAGAFYDSLLMRFNSDSSGAYSYHYLDGFNSSASSAGAASQTFIQHYYTGGNVANTFSANIVDILEYANTNINKTTRGLAGTDANTSGGGINFSSGSWRSTAAINTITLTTGGTTIQQYSQFALYGIKG